ncbi:MAG: aromatic amino acid hydroxylase [Flavobacteriales bacterium]
MVLDYLNEKLEKLPPHLKQFMVPQHYEEYTPVNHAVWRYVMRLNTDYLSRVAHGSYLEGLRKTGITLDRIPSIKDMNRILGEIGWAACTVDGFINPQAFMEFQEYKVLVIAADIRQLNHIEYTPAPDIIHEAAGHAPIIADPAYADYLRYFGEIGCRAFSSGKDFELFEAIRHLSIIKEDPYTPAEDIARGEARIAELSANLGEPSEMSLIRRLHWWTVEYGLIGTLENPQIYGAGLLSSIGESVSCMTDAVAKIPYSLQAAQVDFDITKPQPQLFVTPDFEHLTKVLDEFAETMALRRGGAYGLGLARDSKSLATVVFSGGAAVSGTVSGFETDAAGNVAYVQMQGPSAIAHNGKELPGHGTSYHSEGFGSAAGKFLGTSTPPEHLSDGELEALGIRIGHTSVLEFESGVKVQGTPQSFSRSAEGKLMLMSFKECRVEWNGKTLFDPAWGVYDMAVGSEIISVYSGAADPFTYPVELRMPSDKTHKIDYDADMKRLFGLYQQVRDVRDGKLPALVLHNVWEQLSSAYPSDWLCALEIYEYLTSTASEEPLREEIYHYLVGLAEREAEYRKLIHDGLKLAGAKPLTV